MTISRGTLFLTGFILAAVMAIAGWWYFGKDQFIDKEELYRLEAIQDSLEILNGQLEHRLDSLKSEKARIDTFIDQQFIEIQIRDEKIDRAPVDSVVGILRDLYGPDAVH